jgi:hypothetical protein
VTIWLKLRARLYGLIAAAGLLLAAWLLGRQKGKQAGEADAQAARNDAANANAKAEQLESRHETDAQVAALPDAPAQRVGDAAPGTAAGRLRDDWSRD